jgi:hypothetical protein
VWKGEAENEIRNMGIVNFRQIDQERDGWRRATRGALILLVQCSLRRRRRIRRRRIKRKRRRISSHLSTCTDVYCLVGVKRAYVKT